MCGISSACRVSSGEEGDPLNSNFLLIKTMPTVSLGNSQLSKTELLPYKGFYMKPMHEVWQEYLEGQDTQYADV